MMHGPTDTKLRQLARLDRKQGRIFADVLEPIVKEAGSRERVAVRLGVKQHVIQRLTARRMSVQLERASLERVATALGIDISGWDTSTEL